MQTWDGGQSSLRPSSDRQLGYEEKCLLQSTVRHRHGMPRGWGGHHPFGVSQSRGDAALRRGQWARGVWAGVGPGVLGGLLQSRRLSGSVTKLRPGRSLAFPPASHSPRLHRGPIPAPAGSKWRRGAASHPHPPPPLWEAGAATRHPRAGSARRMLRGRSPPPCRTAALPLSSAAGSALADPGPCRPPARWGERLRGTAARGATEEVSGAGGGSAGLGRASCGGAGCSGGGGGGGGAAGSGSSPAGVPGDGGRRRGGAGFPWSRFRAGAAGQRGGGRGGEGERRRPGVRRWDPRAARPRSEGSAPLLSCVGAVEEVGWRWERSGWGELGAGAAR